MLSKEKDLIAEIARLFSEKLLVDVDSPDTDLLGTGLLDSAMLVELLLQLEEQFGINISMEALELEHFRSLRAIAALVTAQQCCV